MHGGLIVRIWGTGERLQTIDHFPERGRVALGNKNSFRKLMIGSRLSPALLRFKTSSPNSFRQGEKVVGVKEYVCKRFGFFSIEHIASRLYAVYLF